MNRLTPRSWGPVLGLGLALLLALVGSLSWMVWHLRQVPPDSIDHEALADGRAVSARELDEVLSGSSERVLLVLDASADGGSAQEGLGRALTEQLSDERAVSSSDWKADAGEYDWLTPRAQGKGAQDRPELRLYLVGGEQGPDGWAKNLRRLAPETPDAVVVDLGDSPRDASTEDLTDLGDALEKRLEDVPVAVLPPSGAQGRTVGEWAQAQGLDLVRAPGEGAGHRATAVVRALGGGSAG